MNNNVQQRVIKAIAEVTERKENEIRLEAPCVMILISTR